MIRRLGVLIATVTFLACGGYTLVYLYRWEWNRALFTSLLFIAIEVGMVTVLVVHRLARIERSIKEARQPQALERIQETAPARNHFAWLERTTGGTNVFVTVLLGAGVLLSLITWLVDRVASATSRPSLERSLANRLERAAFPAEPLVPDDAELVAQGGTYGADRLDILLGPVR